MTIYPFSLDYFPPMPVMDIFVAAPETTDWHGPFTAEVDTGADFTVVPLALLRPVDPPVVRPAILSSQWQDRRSVYVYEVDLRIGQMVFPAVDVAGDPFSRSVLLGRNILNRLDLHWEGAKLRIRLLR